MSYLRASLVASAILLAGLLAAPAATAGTPSAESSGEACAVGVAPVVLTAIETTAAPIPEPVVDCFPSFGEAVEFATGGELSASVVLGYEYKGTSYTGGSLVLYGTSGSGCGSGSTYGFSSMPSGWSDVISSAKVFASCWSTHYDYTGYSGDRRTCYGSCSSLGTMNNRTSSILFRPRS
ncbi:MAG TPA: hypothetical protein VFR23_06835 [Jiangellaceae bacterium]|nr:hypothetical protein [Jiangellaceae bacterium]